MVILTLCKSLYVCAHNPFCERIALQVKMFFVTLLFKKKEEKKRFVIMKSGPCLLGTNALNSQ